MYRIFQYIKFRSDILVCLVLSFTFLQCIGDKLASSDHIQEIDATSALEAQIEYNEKAMREARLGVKERQGKQSRGIANDKKNINEILERYKTQINDNIKALRNRIALKTFSDKKLSELGTDLSELNNEVERLFAVGKSIEDQVNDLDFSVKKQKIKGGVVDYRVKKLINDYGTTSKEVVKLLEHIEKYKDLLPESEKLPLGVAEELDSIKIKIEKADSILSDKIKDECVTLNTLQKEGVLKEIDLLKETSNKETLNKLNLLRDQVGCAIENNINLFKNGEISEKQKNRRIKRCEVAINKLLDIEKAVVESNSNAVCVIINFVRDSNNRIIGVGKDLAADIFKLDCNDTVENKKGLENDDVNFNTFRDEFIQKTKLVKAPSLVGFDFEAARKNRGAKKLWLGHKSVTDRYGKDKPDSVYSEDYASFAKNNRVDTKVFNGINLKNGNNIQYITVA